MKSWYQKEPPNYDPKRLYQYGIYKLGRREHGSKELARKMARFQSDTQMIDAVILKLQQQGYLDDRRYARMVYNAFHAREAVRKISLRLQQKGIDRELAQEVLGLCQEENQLQTVHMQIMEMLVRRYRVYDHEDFSKMLRFLLGRGFSFGDSRKAIDEFKNIEQSGSAES